MFFFLGKGSKIKGEKYGLLPSPPIFGTLPLSESNCPPPLSLQLLPPSSLNWPRSFPLLLTLTQNRSITGTVWDFQTKSTIHEKIHTLQGSLLDSTLQLYVCVGRGGPGISGTWSPIYGSQCLKLTLPFAHLTDVTLADEDSNSIPTDDVNRAILSNVAMQVAPPGDQY